MMDIKIIMYLTLIFTTWYVTKTCNLQSLNDDKLITYDVHFK